MGAKARLPSSSHKSLGAHLHTCASEALYYCHSDLNGWLGLAGMRHEASYSPAASGLCEAHLLAHQSTRMSDSVLTPHVNACVLSEHESIVGGSLHIVLLNSILALAVLQACSMCCPLRPSDWTTFLAMHWLTCHA